ncbi:MAG: alanine dehydrogenase [Bacteroidota bacterium]
MKLPFKIEEAIAREGGQLLTQEKELKLKDGAKTFNIGIPRETGEDENRISLTPESVMILVQNGHQVLLEAGAGNAAKFADNEYSEAGARIIYSASELYENSNIIVKVNPPTAEEIEQMQPQTVLISALQMSQMSADYIACLNRRKIIGVAFELIEDEVGGLPIVRAMSEIAGSTVLLIAAEYLNSTNNGRGIILGGITGVPPTKVVILGAGTAAEFAARTALGLGAEVKVFDNQLYKLRRIRQELGHQIFTSVIDAANLTDALRRADVVIGALRAEEGRSPCVVTDEMVSFMKPNSVIVDVSIDQGGCFETSKTTSHSKPVFKKYDVIHYCVPNIASRVAHTASNALSNILTPILLKAHDLGGMEEMIFRKHWFMKGVYTYMGHLTGKHIAKMLNMRHKDIDLFRLSKF